jgi:hypothetical protein
LTIKVLFSLATLAPHIKKQRSFVQKNRKIDDESVWSYDFATPYNPFFYNSKIVLNTDNIEQSSK